MQIFEQALDYANSHEDENGVTDYEKTLSKYISTMFWEDKGGVAARIL